jgi:predicted RNase H-like HicB family nuclease
LQDAISIIIVYAYTRGENMKIKVVLEPSEEGGYTAIVPSLPGCISEGDTKEEALKNIREALELYLEPVEDDKIFAPNAETVELSL